jgi:uncharacterized membrane protein YdcZ (DUF606 family)
MELHMWWFWSGSGVLFCFLLLLCICLSPLVGMVLTAVIAIFDKIYMSKLGRQIRRFEQEEQLIKTGKLQPYQPHRPSLKEDLDRLLG